MTVPRSHSVYASADRIGWPSHLLWICLNTTHRLSYAFFAPMSQIA